MRALLGKHLKVCWLQCCDRKSRAAFAQSFALWQQATIEFTCRDHSIIAWSRHIYVSCCSSRTSLSWWITQSTQHHRRGCNSRLWFFFSSDPILFCRDEHGRDEHWTELGWDWIRPLTNFVGFGYKLETGTDLDWLNGKIFAIFVIWEAVCC